VIDAASMICRGFEISLAKGSIRDEVTITSSSSSAMLKLAAEKAITDSPI
jgi:hypothetical protein